MKAVDEFRDNPGLLELSYHICSISLTFQMSASSFMSHSNGRPGSGSFTYRVNNMTMTSSHSAGALHNPGSMQSAGYMQHPANLHSPGNLQHPANLHSPGNPQHPANLHSPGNPQHPGNLHSPGNPQHPANLRSPANPHSPGHSGMHSPAGPHSPGSVQSAGSIQKSVLNGAVPPPLPPKKRPGEINFFRVCLRCMDGNSYDKDQNQTEKLKLACRLCSQNIILRSWNKSSRFYVPLCGHVNVYFNIVQYFVSVWNPIW